MHSNHLFRKRAIRPETMHVKRLASLPYPTNAVLLFVAPVLYALTAIRSDANGQTSREPKALPHVPPILLGKRAAAVYRCGKDGKRLRML